MFWGGRGRRSFHFGLGFRPFGFGFWGPGRFPRREDYVRMLERYKEDLEAELQEVTQELEEMKKSE